MTRSFGDIVAKSIGVTWEPEIKVFPLTKVDKFVVIASDGLWDRVSNEEVANIVGNHYYDKGDPDGATQHLMKEAVDRW